MSLSSPLLICLIVSGFGISAAPPGTDRYGDPLPPGALARLGTVRFRPGNTVWLLACLPDGKSALSVAHGERDIWVSQWRLSTGELLRRHRAPMFSLYSVALSLDGRTLAAAGNVQFGGAHSIRIWDIASGKQTAELADVGRVHALAFSPDGKTLASAGADQTLRLWDTAKRTELRRCQGIKDIRINLAFSADGKSLASTGQRRTLQLWDTATGQAKNVFPLGAGSTGASAFSADLQTLATIADKYKTIRLWNPLTGEKRREIPLDTPTGALALSPDGKILATGDERRESKILAPSAIRLWDVKTDRQLHCLRGHLFGVMRMAFSGDGKYLLSSGIGSMRVWDVARGVEVTPFAEHESYVASVAFSPDGRSVATGGLDGQIRLWQPASHKPAQLFEEGHRQRVWHIAFAPDGRTLISHGHDDTIRLWDVATRRQTQQWKLPEDRLPARITVSPDGRSVALRSRDPVIRLLDATTGQERRSLPGASGNGVFLCFSADGKRLASMSVALANYSGVLQLWDVDSGKEIRRWNVVHAGPLVFSPDGRRLMAVAADVSPSDANQRLIHVWDTATGEHRSFLAPQPARVFCVAVSPDGRTLAWGDTVGVVTLWDIAAGQVRRRIKGHISSVESLAFSPDGRTLVSGSADTTALLWDATGRPAAADTGKLSHDELRALWDDLANKDAAKAFDAIGLLTAAPEQAVSMLREKLHPAPAPADREQMAKLIADLDSDEFAVRKKAMDQLRQLGERAEPGLQQAQKEKRTPEARKRVEELLAGIRASAASPERLRELRAVEVLEHIGTSHARAVLQNLAQGASHARLTREAKAALDRLKRRVLLTP